MSLHRQSQCQRAHRQEIADSCRSPLFLSGDICPYLLATGWFVASGAASRPVNRPLGPSSIRVNTLFAILFQPGVEASEKTRCRAFRWGAKPGKQGLPPRRPPPPQGQRAVRPRRGPTQNRQKIRSHRCRSFRFFHSDCPDRESFSRYCASGPLIRRLESRESIVTAAPNRPPGRSESAKPARHDAI